MVCECSKKDGETIKILCIESNQAVNNSIWY
jgi:hypothetical protein